MYNEADWKRLADIPGNENVEAEPYRHEARRDAARLLHSPSFRRLQGKTQLFPGVESDFFRNRLTHSLEVGQIARSIASRLNAREQFLEPPDFKIHYDLMDFAGWCHDLGHPPFGHTGEAALDRSMRDSGGFEGNAQTLRILTRLEKRQHDSEHPSGVAQDGTDLRLGLNLTARSLAAILKYDREIPMSAADRDNANEIVKGFYRSERDIVRRIKYYVTGVEDYAEPFKTIECQIMDIADDIAYSTYDLEDAFKANFLTPLSILEAPEPLVQAISKRVSGTIGRNFSPDETFEVLRGVFGDIADAAGSDRIEIVRISHGTSRALADDGYIRTRFTSELVASALQAVEFEPNEQFPALSKVRLPPEMLVRVEVLKHLSFIALILSPRLKVSQFRGDEVVGELFRVLSSEEPGGNQLLPDDVRVIYDRIDEMYSKRVIADFIAGMTDRYAIEFFGRLRSENPQTIYKPL